MVLSGPLSHTEKVEHTLSNYKQLRLITTKLTETTVKGGNGGRSRSRGKEHYMRENGAHLRAQSVTHNTAWPPHTPNRKYLNMCVGEREKGRESAFLPTHTCLC